MSRSSCGFGFLFFVRGYLVSVLVERNHISRNSVLVLGANIDAWACDTLRYNHPQMTVIQNDIRELNTLTTVKEICLYNPDIIIGGPPCQGFSIAGPAQKDPNDPRNTLFINFAQWISFLQPKAFVMENVKGLLSRKNTDGVNVIDLISNKFAEMGYFVEIWLLNSAEYGVPQSWLIEE